MVWLCLRVLIFTLAFLAGLLFFGPSKTVEAPSRPYFTSTQRMPVLTEPKCGGDKFMSLRGTKHTPLTRI
jgi:hypothetical protein